MFKFFALQQLESDGVNISEFHIGYQTDETVAADEMCSVLRSIVGKITETLGKKMTGKTEEMKKL